MKYILQFYKKDKKRQKKTQRTPPSAWQFNQSDVQVSCGFSEQQVSEGKWAPVPVSIGRNQLLLLSGTEGLLCVKCWILHQSNWQLLHLNYRKRWWRSKIPLRGSSYSLKSKTKLVMEYCWSPSEILKTIWTDFAIKSIQRKIGEKELKQVHSVYPCPSHTPNLLFDSE